MACYLITYDLNKEKNRPPIVEKIKEIANGWAKLSESSYAINHSGSADSVYQLLKSMIDDNDHILVIPMYQPYQGFHEEDVHSWLQANLPTK